VRKVIYVHEGKELNEESALYSVIYDILIARWTKGYIVWLIHSIQGTTIVYTVQNSDSLLLNYLLFF
jgi:hypothetical protein